MKLKQKNKHIRDDDVRLSDDFEISHKYFVNGMDNYTSCTSFIKSFFREFSADDIIKNNYTNWQNNTQHKYFGLNQQEIKEIWEKKRLSSSEFGTKIHNEIECSLNGENSSCDDLELVYFNNFIKESNFEPYRTEWQVYDEDTLLVGTIDAVFKDNDKFLIVDWKTNIAIKHTNHYQNALYPINYLQDCNYIVYCLQLNLYKYILEKNYGIEIDRMYLVWLNSNNNNYVLIPIENMQKEIVAMLFNSKRI